MRELEKRRPLRAVGEEDRELLRKIFNHSNDAIFVFDAERDQILDANPAACRMLGYSHDELLSLPLSAIHPKEMPQLLAFAGSVIEQGQGWTDELCCRTRDGNELASEISASVTRVGDRPCIIAFVRDISDRKRAEEALKAYSEKLETLVEERTADLIQLQERQRFLLDVTNALIENLNRDALFNALVETLSRRFHFNAAAICIDVPERGVFRLFALDTASLPGYSFERESEFDRQNSHVGWVIDNKRPLLRRNLERERQYPLEDALLTQGVRSYVIVPLLVKGRALGTLNIASKSYETYSEADATFLQEVGMQISLAIENMRAYEEIARLKSRLEVENLYLQEEIRTERNFEEIVGQSPTIKSVMKAVETVAPTDATVLILGETGTGKELVARAIHKLSHRSDRALVKVNCAALPSGLIESELFGHEKGAFTGALARKLGRFELADGGTIFLDEVGDLPLDLQAKLLRVLQEGEFERVGSAHTIKVNARVIAATNRELQNSIEQGKFRSDLYYRLSVFPIQVPALRERKGDLPLLVKYLVVKHSKKLGKRVESVSRRVMDELLDYAWPGNVRELENVIERSVITSPGPQLELRDWLPRPSSRPPIAQRLTLEEVERRHILNVLEQVGWRVSGKSGAAALLALKPTTLEARMKKLGIKRKS
jgi:formate hydrogenlyase transcriptional activator